MNPPVKDLSELLIALMRPSTLIEMAVLLGVMVLSWLLLYALGGRQQSHAHPRSIWFGSHLIDGALYPMLALALAYVARRVLRDLGHPTTVFHLALPILLSLLSLRISVRVLRLAFPSSVLVRAIERTVSWIVWVLMVLWVTGLLPAILEELDQIQWPVGTHALSLRNVIEGALSAGLVMVVVLWISAALEVRLLAGAAGAQLSVRKMLANVLRAALLLTGLLLALSAVGIDLTALSVLGGALGVGIGLGLQKLAANYVSGFVILAERSLRIGDLVRVTDFEGIITDITTRYTLIRSPSGREALVPNETLLTTTVQNLSLADRNLLVTTIVSVGYDTDVESLRERLVDAVQQVPRVLTDPGPAVLLSAFGADGLELTIHFWIGDPENGQGPVRSAVNLVILALLRREGIEIPFPQRVLHHSPAPASTVAAAGPLTAPAAESSP